MRRRSFTAHRSFSLHPKVALGRLYRDVHEEELDLVQFAAGEVAQSDTGASQIVRGQLIDASGGGRIPHDVPLTHYRLKAVDSLPTKSRLAAKAA